MRYANQLATVLMFAMAAGAFAAEPTTAPAAEKKAAGKVLVNDAFARGALDQKPANWTVAADEGSSITVAERDKVRCLKVAKGETEGWGWKPSATKKFRAVKGALKVSFRCLVEDKDVGFIAVLRDEGDYNKSQTAAVVVGRGGVISVPAKDATVKVPLPLGKWITIEMVSDPDNGLYQLAVETPGENAEVQRQSFPYLAAPGKSEQACLLQFTNVTAPETTGAWYVTDVKVEAPAAP